MFEIRANEDIKLAHAPEQAAIGANHKDNNVEKNDTKNQVITEMVTS